MKPLSILAAVALFILPSCGFISVNSRTSRSLVEASGATITKVYDLSAFHKIYCNFSCNMYYTTGDNSLEIDAPENVIEHLVVSVNNGRLSIKSDGTRFVKVRDKVTIRVSAPTLESVNLNGAARFQADRIDTRDLDIELNGAGDIIVDEINAKDIEVNINGAGNAHIFKAICEDFDAEINGAGDCEVIGEFYKIDIEINGAGNCKVAGKAEIADFCINGAGNINIRNLEANRISSSTHGVGKVIRK